MVALVKAEGTLRARGLLASSESGHQQPVSHIHAIVNDSANKTGVLTLLRRRRYIYVLTETWKIIRARSELGFRVLEWSTCALNMFYFT